MKFIKHGLVYDTDKSRLLGESDWVEAWFTDGPGLEEKRYFYKTKNGRYFSVSEERNYEVSFFQDRPHPASQTLQIRTYENLAECVGWMDSYKIRSLPKLREA